jgi:hypothetical protein
MYAALRRAAPLRRRAVSALAAAVLHQQQPAAAAPRLPAQLPAAASAAAAAWFHSAPAWLGFRETGPAGASARAQFAEEGSFYEDEKRAGGGAGAGAGAGAAAQEGLEIAKLGISSKIVDRLASKGITKLFPIQVTRRGGSSPLFRSKMNHMRVESSVRMEKIDFFLHGSGLIR